MYHVGIDFEQIRRRYQTLDYLVVAQLFLQDNFLLERPLDPKDVKPRLLGHWGTCHGINVAYANFKAFYDGNSNYFDVISDMFFDFYDCYSKIFRKSECSAKDICDLKAYIYEFQECEV